MNSQFVEFGGILQLSNFGTLPQHTLEGVVYNEEMSCMLVNS